MQDIEYLPSIKYGHCESLHLSALFWMQGGDISLSTYINKTFQIVQYS